MGTRNLSVNASVNRAWFILALLVMAGLSAYLLYPALFLDRSLVHGDNIHHSYSLLKFHHDVVHNGVSPLWTNLVYGGHALFAEGQAGLSNPLNYLVAWLASPEFGHNLIHWLSITAFGVGCYGLSRSLCVSPASSLFAALAAGFSSLTIHTNTNMTAIEAMVWVPWTLWAFESWLQRPGAGRAIWFGLATAMLIFSGYPHFLHGTAIYMVASLCTVFQGGPLRRTFPDVLSRYWRSGVLAVLVCVGISSVQWLPLLELAAHSHRQQGIGIALNGTAEFLARGLLYSTDNFVALDIPSSDYFPNTGSLLVCVLASLCVIFGSSARMKGHIVATLLLLNLGFASHSPIYRFVTAYGLIPGIDSFRMMFPYFIMSIVGIAVLAGNSVDGLARLTKQSFTAVSGWLALRWALLLLFWCFVLYTCHTSAAPALNYLILGLGVLGLLLLVAFKRSQLYPLYACVIILAEILLLKLAPFNTVEIDTLVREPASVRHIKAQDPDADFKHFQLGLVPLTFSSPYSGALEGRTNNELNHLVASTNLLWGVPSFSGALALRSNRKPMANDAVTGEIQGSGDASPGARLMDLLSIRWISNSLRGATTSRHLVPIRNGKGQLLVWENPHALPLIQTFASAHFVADAEEALRAIQGSTEAALYVEADPADFAHADQPQVAGKIRLRTIRKSPTRYRFESNSADGFWLFLSDTIYPGWKATIDDQPVQVYPAQVLGKALYVPSGRHRIKVYFQSDSFRLGALLSLATLLCLMLAGIWAIRRRFARAGTK